MHLVKNGQLFARIKNLLVLSRVWLFRERVGIAILLNQSFSSKSSLVEELKHTIAFSTCAPVTFRGINP